MKMPEIIEIIKDLARSQGSYGRLYSDLMQLKEVDQDAYNKLTEEWEREEFQTPLDLISFLEEGKHCKRKVWKIPVTWEMYGCVEVEAATIKEAIEKFKERESSSEDFPLPTGGEYVDGSFWLSDTDEENLEGTIALMNKENLEEEEK